MRATKTDLRKTVIWVAKLDRPEPRGGLIPWLAPQLGFDRDDLVTGRMRWTDLIPPEWRDRAAQARQELRTTGTVQPFEREYLRKDGGRVPVLIGAASAIGQLTASIAHEVNQPIAATKVNAQAALRWLNRDVPDLERGASATDQDRKRR
jgi:PAS domain-containing protein